MVFLVHAWYSTVSTCTYIQCVCVCIIEGYMPSSDYNLFQSVLVMTFSKSSFTLFFSSLKLDELVKPNPAALKIKRIINSNSSNIE